jgi:hypothetical protein
VGVGAAGHLLAGAEAEDAAVGVGERGHDAEVYASRTRGEIGETARVVRYQPK